MNARKQWPRRVAMAGSLLAACAALLWGLGRLEGIFIAERAAAVTEVEARREALGEYAKKSLTQALEERLRRADGEIDRALADPLLPASALYFADESGQLLPRAWQPIPSASTPGRELHERLATRRYVAAEPDSPWAERLDLLSELRTALAIRDRTGIERLVRTILGHRASYVLPITLDAPFVLVVVDELATRANASHDLLVMLLRDGVTGAGGQHIDGLERALLRRRDRLGADDFEYLAAAVAKAARRHGVGYDDFVARAAESPAGDVPISTGVAEPALFDRARWIAAPAPGGSVRGVRVDTAALLGEVRSQMHTLGLLADADGIALANPALAALSDEQPPPASPDAGDTDTFPLRVLTIRVDSPTFAVGAAAAESRFQLKTGLVVAVGVLAFGVLGLMVLLQRRRQRFLALKSEFVAAVSHELRTPLASIQLMAETLERRLRDVPAARDYPTRIVRDVEGLARLVENILSWQRLERGFAPRFDGVRLSEFVERLRVALERSDKRVVLRTSGIEGTTLWADPDLVELVLSNLAKNARQYCEREPVELFIEATTLPDGRGVRLSFMDNGVGIPAADATRVFEDFYRGSRRPPRSGRGSGLGLAICRKVMEAHAGRIELVATSAAGTTFVLHFPDAPGRPSDGP